MEDWRMRRVGRVVGGALCLAQRCGSAALGDHRADLYRRSMRPHQQAVAGRLRLRCPATTSVSLRKSRAGWLGKIQRFEVAGIAGPEDRGVLEQAEVMEHSDDLVHRLQQRVFDPRHPDAARQRNVDPGLRRRAMERPAHERRLNLLFQLVEAYAQRLACLGGRVLQPGIADRLPDGPACGQPSAGEKPQRRRKKRSPPRTSSASVAKAASREEFRRNRVGGCLRS